jgi:hypothetical protein
MHAVHAAAAARDYAKACTCRCCSEGAVLPHSQRPGVMHLGGMRQRARAWVAPPADALAALVLEGELWAAFAMKKSMMIKEAKALETCPETGRAIVNWLLQNGSSQYFKILNNLIFCQFNIFVRNSFLYFYTETNHA